MNSQLNKVIATGGWKSGQPCPDREPGKVHSFRDIQSKPSPTAQGRKAGERLITSQCKFCGCLIVDCPTINL